MKAAEQHERAHLSEVKRRLRAALETIDTRLEAYRQDIQAQKTYLWESRAEMDHVEKIASRQSIDQALMSGDQLLASRKRLRKLAASPYFGRFDFVPADGDDANAIYIGVHGFHDGGDDKAIVHDWRAPVASMFYDHETGPAWYEAPAGRVHGEMVMKRQFRIRDGEMEFMLDSAVNIMDDVLQEELSRTSDEGMKNIVATIQRDQNAIIRDEHASVLIIQGVAGSGKTSIALHRIAFLLYRFKDTLSSEDILIISPNRVFADYISNVLPELGEETVSEVQMETLAAELLEHEYRFQTFFEQTAQLLKKPDEALQERIAVKSSADFLATINAYAAHVEKNSFTAGDLWIGRRLVPGWLLEETFQKHRGHALTERVNRTAAAIEQKIGIQYHYDLRADERAELKQAIRGMYRRSTLRETYKGLFTWMGRPELFKAAGGRLEYADVFPLIHLKMRLEGKSTSPRRVKHLLIDEMQDYTPVQYAVIARLFNCKKTILGDANQAVNPYGSSTATTIRDVFQQGTCVQINKSYRSTWEITRFAQGISPDPELVAIERHGELPRVIRCRNKADETAHIAAIAAGLADCGHHTLGIICKTQARAEALAGALEEAGLDPHLLSAASTTFSQGIMVCTAHKAKGLEFDQVIVAEATARNYHTAMDRNLLYVACTRAMHRLTLTHVGKATALIPDTASPAVP